MFRVFIVLSFCVCCSKAALSQRLDLFGAENGKYLRNGVERRIAYAGIISWFDYAEKDSISNDSLNGQPVHFLYFYLPDSTSELGIRLISPVPEKVFPEGGDFATEIFWKNKNKKESYFDPEIILQQAIGINFPLDSSLKENEIVWIDLGKNDNSEELIPQPNGLRNNSLVRVLKSNSLKLDRGLYRIAFKSAKNKAIQGSYIIQIGALVPLKGMKIFTTLGLKD